MKSLDQDLWNLDLDDILEMPRSSRAPLTRSFTGGPSPSLAPDVKKSKRRSLPGRQVSFDSVKIRVFERVLGENPPTCGAGGPSLGLGWNYNEKKAVAVDKFETKRECSWSTKRRNSKELLMSPEKRERMARKLGFTSHEIEKNVKDVEKIVKQRSRTRSTFEPCSNPVAIMERALRCHGYTR